MTVLVACRLGGSWTRGRRAARFISYVYWLYDKGSAGRRSGFVALSRNGRHRSASDAAAAGAEADVVCPLMCSSAAPTQRLNSVHAGRDKEIITDCY